MLNKITKKSIIILQKKKKNENYENSSYQIKQFFFKI